jgi:hypothetical protein
MRRGFASSSEPDAKAGLASKLHRGSTGGMLSPHFRGKEVRLEFKVTALESIGAIRLWKLARLGPWFGFPLLETTV